MSKMKKKILLLILINLFALIVGAVIIETYSRNEYQKTYSKIIKDKNKVNEQLGQYKIVLDYKLLDQYNYGRLRNMMRPPIYIKSGKRPLLFVGCSYGYGFGLNENQTLPYKMAKLTNRTAYNRSIPSAGIQHIYYQLNRDDFYNEVPDAEYIIYTFIDDHINRLYHYPLAFFGIEANLRYKIVNGKLEQIKPMFLPMYSLYTVRRIQADIEEKKVANQEESFNLFLKIAQESLKLARKHYKNVKFVILTYKDPTNKTLTTQQIELLKKAGFIVIDSEKLVGHELTSKQYKIDDGDHPSEKAWNEVAPKLVKTLNL